MRFFPHPSLNCFFLLFFCIAQADSDPLLISDRGLAEISGQSGVEISDLNFTRDEGESDNDKDKNENCEEDENCEEEGEGGGSPYSFQMPDSGFLQDDSLGVQMMLETPLSVSVSIRQTMTVIKAVRGISNLPVRQSSTFPFRMSGGLF